MLCRRTARRATTIAFATAFSLYAPSVDAQVFGVQALTAGCTRLLDPVSNQPVYYTAECSDDQYAASVRASASRGLLVADTSMSWFLGFSYGESDVQSLVNDGQIYGQVSDLVFSGPPGATSVPMSFSVQIDFETDPGNGAGNPPGSFSAQVGGATVSWNSWQTTPPTYSASGVYLSNATVVPLNTPVNYAFQCAARLRVFPGQTQRTRMEVAFGGGRNSRVFDLPEGYTANSPSLNIVDNVWVPPQFCAAERTGDGLLNVDDVDVFVAAFLEGSPDADLDANRVLNQDDVDTFVESFLAGCP